MSLEKIGHYSLTSQASVYDEEALTALELAGRTATKVNQAVTAFNELETETNQHLVEQDTVITKRLDTQDNVISTRLSNQDVVITNMNDVVMPATVSGEVQKRIDNGTFDRSINSYIGNLEERVDNLLGTVTAGSTTMDSEVIDLRVDVDGTTHQNAGQSVRTQISKVSSDIVNLDNDRIDGHIKLQASDFRQLGYDNLKFYAENLRISSTPKFLPKGTTVEIKTNGFFFCWYVTETADGSTEPLQFNNNWNNKNVKITLDYDGYFFVVVANAKGYNQSTKLTPYEYNSDVTIWSGYSNQWVKEHGTETECFMETLSKKYDKADFVEYFLSKGKFSTDTYRVTSILPGKFPKGTKFTIVSDEHYVLVDVYENPVDGVTEQTVLESSTWLGKGQPATSYILNNDGYVVLLGANGKTYGASTVIAPDDYLGVIEVKYPIVAKLDNAVTAETLKERTFASTYNELGGSDQHVKNFCKLYKTIGKGDGFLFFTDMHVVYKEGWEKRLMETTAYIEQIANTTPVSFVLNGGDWLGSWDTQDEALRMLSRIHGTMKSKFGDSFAMLLGNHETNYQGHIDENSATQDGILPQSALDNTYSALRRKSYYLYEAPTFNLYCFDTGIETSGLSTDYYKNQVHWFAESLLTDEAEHKAMAMHIIYNRQDLCPLTDELSYCANAFNNRTSYTFNGVTYNFAGGKGKVAFMIGGHEHSDKNGVVNGLPYVITTNCSDYGSYTTLPLDLCAIDWDARKLYLYRCEIGAEGSTRTIDIIS